MAFVLSSPAFKTNGQIPRQYTCDGKGISPALQWNDAPAGTQSFTLIMDDPDAPAGTWDHWLMINIPAQTHELTENLATLPTGAIAGKNSWGKLNYGGPCPPDKEHRYIFKLYALDNQLNLTKGANKTAILQAMQGHILATAELFGRYNRH